MRYKSIKIGKSKYRAPRPKRKCRLNANRSLSIVKHKNRWVIALTEGWDREFYSCDTINRSEALRIISFLADYVNLVKPTEATALNASLKASTNRIVKTGQELAGIAIRCEEQNK
jgi:hypothetical protein